MAQEVDQELLLVTCEKTAELQNRNTKSDH